MTHDPSTHSLLCPGGRQLYAYTQAIGPGGSRPVHFLAHMIHSCLWPDRAVLSPRIAPLKHQIYYIGLYTGKTILLLGLGSSEDLLPRSLSSVLLQGGPIKIQLRIHIDLQLYLENGESIWQPYTHSPEQRPHYRLFYLSRPRFHVLAADAYQWRTITTPGPIGRCLLCLY